MTLYFRPDSADLQSNSHDSKIAERQYSIILHLIKVENEEQKKLISYQMEEENSEFLNNSKFIGLLVKGHYKLQIAKRISGQVIGTETLDLPEWIKDFKSCKNNKFESNLNIMQNKSKLETISLFAVMGTTSSCKFVECHASMIFEHNRQASQTKR